MFLRVLTRWRKACSNKVAVPQPSIVTSYISRSCSDGAALFLASSTQLLYFTVVVVLTHQCGLGQTLLQAAHATAQTPIRGLSNHG